MLQKKSLQSIGFFILVLIGVLIFTVILAGRFQKGNTSPSADNTRSTTQVKTESLDQTDKTELSQTEMITVEPSTVVTNAEKSLPNSAEPSYVTACQKLKDMYINESVAKRAEEDRRHAQAQQSIINSFSSAGLSFSSNQKTVQSLEAKRHDSVLKQLESQLQKQLAGIRC